MQLTNFVSQNGALLNLRLSLVAPTFFILTHLHKSTQDKVTHDDSNNDCVLLSFECVFTSKKAYLK